MAAHPIHHIAQWWSRIDLFSRCLAFATVLHLTVLGAYYLANLPPIQTDEKVYDARTMKFEPVDVDYIELPLTVPIEGTSNPAPVEKHEWIEGSGEGAPDAPDVDRDINKLSGDGTDPDGYAFAELSDHPPIPIIDFNLNRYFPEEARSANIARKTVVTLVQVNEDGSLKSVKVISPPSGYGFDRAATEVVRRIRFKPGRIKGKPVKMVLQLPITFVLED